IHETIDLAIAIKGEWPPWSIEVTPFQKLLRRAAEDAAGSFPIGTLAPAQQSEHGFAGIAEHLFEPSVERRLEHRVGRIFGGDLEHRIDAGFDRPLAQEVRAKRVNSADARFFELRERPIQMFERGRSRNRIVTRSFDLGAQPELKLTRRLFRKRYRDDVGKLAAS